MIADESLDSSSDLICETDQELTSRVSIELIVDVSLNLSLTPDLKLLSCGIYFSDELVHVGIAIEVSPKNLPVLRIISSSKVLLSSVVNDWNTN